MLQSEGEGRAPPQASPVPPSLCLFSRTPQKISLKTYPSPTAYLQGFSSSQSSVRKCIELQMWGSSTLFQGHVDFLQVCKQYLEKFSNQSLRILPQASKCPRKRTLLYPRILLFWLFDSTAVLWKKQVFYFYVCNEKEFDKNCIHLIVINKGLVSHRNSKIE